MFFILFRDLVDYSPECRAYVRVDRTYGQRNFRLYKNNLQSVAASEIRGVAEPRYRISSHYRTLPNELAAEANKNADQPITKQEAT